MTSQHPPAAPVAAEEICFVRTRSRKELIGAVADCFDVHDEMAEGWLRDEFAAVAA